MTLLYGTCHLKDELVSSFSYFLIVIVIISILFLCCYSRARRFNFDSGKLNHHHIFFFFSLPSIIHNHNKIEDEIKMLRLLTQRPLIRPLNTPSTSCIIQKTLFNTSSILRNNNQQQQHKPKVEVHQYKPQVDVSQHPIFKRLPKSLHKYAANFANTPVSHVTSFLILHELSAIAPLFGFWYLFHSLDFVPPHLPQWLTENGVDFIKLMAERNGWDFSTQDGTKWLVEGAASYALVKVLMPVRAALSLVLMPWFANTFVIPLTKIFRVFARKPNAAPPQSVWEEDLTQGPKRKQIKKPQDPNRPQL